MLQIQHLQNNFTTILSLQVFISYHLYPPLSALYHLTFTAWHINIFVRLLWKCCICSFIKKKKSQRNFQVSKTNGQRNITKLKKFITIHVIQNKQISPQWVSLKLTNCFWVNPSMRHLRIRPNCNDPTLLVPKWHSNE